MIVQDIRSTSALYLTIRTHSAKAPIPFTDKSTYQDLQSIVSSRKRHHYIPRVILNRFASWSDSEKKKYKIWQISKARGAKEVSTKDVAVQKHMYGEDDALELALVDIEGDFGTTLRLIDEGTPPTELAKELSFFVWLQSWRTQSIRNRVQKILHELLQEMSAQIGGLKFKETFLTQGLIRAQEHLKTLSHDEYVEFQKKSGIFGADTFLQLIILFSVLGGQHEQQIRTMINLIGSVEFLNDAGKSALNKSTYDAIQRSNLARYGSLMFGMYGNLILKI